MTEQAQALSDELTETKRLLKVIRDDRDAWKDAGLKAEAKLQSMNLPAALEPKPSPSPTPMPLGQGSFPWGYPVIGGVALTPEVWQQVHLRVNHLPLVGIPLAATLLFVALMRGLRESRLVALATLAPLAWIAYPISYTGHWAVGFNRDERMVRYHQDAAFWGLNAGIVVSVLAVAAFVLTWRKRERLGLGFAWAAVATSVVATLLLAFTAYYGGKFRHGG